MDLVLSFQSNFFILFHRQICLLIGLDLIILLASGCVIFITVRHEKTHCGEVIIPDISLKQFVLQFREILRVSGFYFD